MALILRNNRSLQPRNNGSVNIARSAIDQTLPRAIRQYENALSVNGFPIIYYRRRNTGLRCTCCGGQTPTGPVPMTPDVLQPGVTVLDSEGAGTEDFLNSMLQGSVFSIDRYGSRNRMVDANGGDNPQRSVPHSPLIQSKEIHNKSGDMDDPFVDQLEPTDTDDLFDTGIENNLAVATATTGCAVCLGTGWVGGYDPSNAMRVVYDTQAPWSGSLLLDQTSAPDRWLLQGDRTVSIKVLMPAGAVGLEAFRVWNNRDQISQVQAWLRTPNGTVLFDRDVPNFCDGTYKHITLVFSEAVEAFTHLEIQFEMGLSPVYAEWSRLSYNENLQLPENMDTPNLVISPSLPHVSLYDLVTESVYRKIWKITSSNPAFDRERQVNGWEVTARLLQTYELPNLLPRRQERVWYWGNRVAVQPRDVPGTHNNEPYSAVRATQPR